MFNTFEENLEVVLSNLPPETAGELLDAYDNDSPAFQELLHESFYAHPPECQGGYADYRCPCAVSAKGVHTLMALVQFDRSRREP